MMSLTLLFLPLKPVQCYANSHQLRIFIENPISNVLSQFDSRRSAERPRGPLAFVLWNIGLIFKAHEVESEFAGRHVDFLEQSKQKAVLQKKKENRNIRHAENFRVEFERLARVFDTKHRLLHNEFLRRFLWLMKVLLRLKNANCTIKTVCYTCFVFS